VILEPDRNAPAAQVANNQIVADYDDPAALHTTRGSVRRRHLRIRECPGQGRSNGSRRGFLVRPGSKALQVAQDRLLEKAMASDLGAETALFAAIWHPLAILMPR
jgi:5-(carboxyamino)imidazole ribonucleotide synthase